MTEEAKSTSPVTMIHVAECTGAPKANSSILAASVTPAGPPKMLHGPVAPATTARLSPATVTGSPSVQTQTEAQLLSQVQTLKTHIIQLSQQLRESQASNERKDHIIQEHQHALDRLERIIVPELKSLLETERDQAARREDALEARQVELQGSQEQLATANATISELQRALSSIAVADSAKTKKATQRRQASNQKNIRNNKKGSPVTERKTRAKAVRRRRIVKRRKAVTTRTTANSNPCDGHDSVHGNCGTTRVFYRASVGDGAIYLTPVQF